MIGLPSFALFADPSIANGNFFDTNQDVIQMNQICAPPSTIAVPQS